MGDLFNNKFPQKNEPAFFYIGFLQIQNIAQRNDRKNKFFLGRAQRDLHALKKFKRMRFFLEWYF